MSTVDVSGILPGLLADAGLPTEPVREPLRVWAHSGVERLRFTHALEAAAPCRVVGAELPPFGLCHSEYHPTSLHIGARGWHLLDFARAFTGPGLLDLASWHGTLGNPDPARTTGLIKRYVALGGHQQALAPRGGLDAASWALGWHRLWAADSNSVAAAGVTSPASPPGTVPSAWAWTATLPRSSGHVPGTGTCPASSLLSPTPSAT
jgi:hypothetical protein